MSVARIFRNAVLALVLATACFGAPEPAPPEAGDDAPRLMDRLGNTHFPVTTASPVAQRYFDQGLALSYGFNHDAAVRSFAAAVRLDPGCAMCEWGIALALGPNINAPMGPDAGRRAHAASQRALTLAPGATAKERELVSALATRYAADPPADRAALDRAYAEAMMAVQKRHPENVDVATLTAEALMDLTPWNYWTADGKPREHTEEALRLLESVIQRAPDHVGANHYYIHATEEFYPERAERSADRLSAQDLEAGHLVHMPSHIYWRLGRYEDALEINVRAAAADEDFFSWCRGGAFYRAAYYPHNVHFLWAAAGVEGRSEIALSTSRKLEAVTAERVEEFDFLEEFMAIPMVTLVRFGRWDAVLGTPRPDERRRYLLGIWHYTRGLAFVRTARLDEAGAELASLRAVADEEANRALVLAGGTAPASQLLGIGLAHLEGELSAARGDREAALAALVLAVERQDALVYMEPPPWYFPTRQALGAVLLDAGRAGEAEAVYRRDLEQHPGNGWSLYGLARSLDAQGKKADARWADQGFRNAWARADVELRASRF
jgi:tetratricopeptide (TPR) repeat protein